MNTSALFAPFATMMGVLLGVKDEFAAISAYLKPRGKASYITCRDNTQNVKLGLKTACGL